MDLSGVVEAIGPFVTGFKIGDEAFGSASMSNARAIDMDTGKESRTARQVSLIDSLQIELSKAGAHD